MGNLDIYCGLRFTSEGENARVEAEQSVIVTVYKEEGISKKKRKESEKKQLRNGFDFTFGDATGEGCEEKGK